MSSPAIIEEAYKELRLLSALPLWKERDMAECGREIDWYLSQCEHGHKWQAIAALQQARMVEVTQREE